MTNMNGNVSKSIWDQRYKDSELACTKKNVQGDPIDYTQHPFLYQHSIAKRLTGTLDGNPLDVIASRFLCPPAKRLLALGSGMAYSEEWLVKCGYVDRVDIFESSAVAVEAVRERIAQAGLQSQIDVHNEDVVSVGLDDGAFDVVFVQAAIHHFFDIEEMFALMHRVLKPNGLLIYDEYIGPDHHLYEPEVMALMDELNACLAARYRWDILRNETREAVPRATLEWMMQMDPSEGVHASMILPLTYKWFNVEYRGDYGGTFMRPFFVGILPNFDFADEKDQTIARLVVLIEDLLARYGVIPHYHTRIVARRRDYPLDDLSETQTKRINYSNWIGLRQESTGEPSKSKPKAGFLNRIFGDRKTRD